MSSALFLHHQMKRADQGRGQQNSDALERPDIIGHQQFADSLDGDWLDLDGVSGSDFVFAIAQTNPTNTAMARSHRPVKLRTFPVSSRVRRMVKTIRTATAPM